MELFGLNEGILVQQVNCKDAMSAGLAKAIYEQYPQVKEDYHKSFSTKTSEELFGTYRLINISDKLKVANLYTQFDYADPNKPETLGKIYTDKEKLVAIINKLHLDYPDDTIYIPLNIGCGLGGGVWEEVIEDINNLHIDKLMVIDTMKKIIFKTNIANAEALYDYFSKLTAKELKSTYFFSETDAEYDMILLEVLNSSHANFYLDLKITLFIEENEECRINCALEYEFSKKYNMILKTNCYSIYEYRAFIDKILNELSTYLKDNILNELKAYVLV